MWCEKCGTMLPDGAIFCPKCGAKCEAGGQNVTPQPADHVDLGQAAAPQAHEMGIGSRTAPALSQAAGVAASVGAGVAATAGSVAVKAVAGGAKTASRTVKRIAILTLVLAFIVGAISAWLGFFVSGPEDTVEKFFTSVENYDFDGMLSCMDPKLEQQVRAIMGISSGIFGGLTGFDIDLEALMTVAPMFKDILEMPEMGAELASCEVVLYTDYGFDKTLRYVEQATQTNGEGLTGQYLSDNSIISFLQKYHISIPGLEKAIAKTAIVRVTMADGSGEMYIPMQNIGRGDWRLLIDPQSMQ